MNKEIVYGVIVIVVSVLVMIATAKLNNNVNSIEVVILEGHEYFKCPSYGFNYSLTHKANCKFCIGEKNE